MTTRISTNADGYGINPAHSINRKYRRISWKVRLLALFLCVILSISTVIASAYVDLQGQITEAVLDTTALGSDEYAIQADSFAGRALNILIVGTDSRYDQDTNIVSEKDTTSSIRSDTSIVMHISADRKNVTMVSIPRDLWTSIPSCKLSNGTSTIAQTGQFNWAFSYGADVDIASGIACTQATVEKLTGIAIDGFIVVDFTGFVQLIDVMGGLDICIEEAVNDKSYTGLVLAAGCYTLDSYTALAYARVRYGVGDGSDISRIDRQQQVIAAMISQMLSSQIISSPKTVYDLISQMLGVINISSSFSSVTTDVALLWSLKDIEVNSVQFITMPTTTASFNVNRVVAYDPYATNLWNSLFNDTYLPEGITYTNLENEEFTMCSDGVAMPGSTSVSAFGVGSTSGCSAYLLELEAQEQVSNLAEDTTTEVN